MFNAIVKVDFLKVERIFLIILIMKTSNGFGSVVAKSGSKIVGCSHGLRDGFE